MQDPDTAIRNSGIWFEFGRVLHRDRNRWECPEDYTSFNEAVANVSNDCLQTFWSSRPLKFFVDISDIVRQLLPLSGARIVTENCLNRTRGQLSGVRYQSGTELPLNCRDACSRFDVFDHCGSLGLMVGPFAPLWVLHGWGGASFRVCDSNRLRKSSPQILSISPQKFLRGGVVWLTWASWGAVDGCACLMSAKDGFHSLTVGIDGPPTTRLSLTPLRPPGCAPMSAPLYGTTRGRISRWASGRGRRLARSRPRGCPC